MKVNKNDVLLMALAAAGGDAYLPVQLQKLMFLLDRNLPRDLGAPFFEFRPYDYGAFDSGVYSVANALSLDGLVLIDRNPGTPIRTYAATKLGRETGAKMLNEIPAEVKEYILEASQWVRSMTFAQLVAAMYEAYPDTKVNSVFRDYKDL
jgi:hypothetical protein